jgi:hypothetical protein
MDENTDDFNERIHDAIRGAEILSLFFVRVGKSMILDFRQEPGSQAAVLLDDIVATPQARLQSFRRLRPGLPLPERLTLAPWTSAIQEFRANGLLDAMLSRCELEGGQDLKVTAAKTYRQLELLERRYLRDLVQGVGLQTIWRRSDP